MTLELNDCLFCEALVCVLLSFQRTLRERKTLSSLLSAFLTLAKVSLHKHNQIIK